MSQYRPILEEQYHARRTARTGTCARGRCLQGVGPCMPSPREASQGAPPSRTEATGGGGRSTSRHRGLARQCLQRKPSLFPGRWMTAGRSPFSPPAKDGVPAWTGGLSRGRAWPRKGVCREMSQERGGGTSIWRPIRPSLGAVLGMRAANTVNCQSPASSEPADSETCEGGPISEPAGRP